MASIAQWVGGLNVYLNRYEDRISPRYLTKAAGRDFGLDEVWRFFSTSNHAAKHPAVIMDLGCGTGWVSRKLASRYSPSGTSVLGIDRSSHAIDVARRNRDTAGISADLLDFRQADLEICPWDAAQLGLRPEQRADEIWLCGSLHQMRNPAAILREAHQLLAPHGRLCLQTLEEPEAHHQRVDFAVMRALGQRIFRPGECAALLAETHFSVTQLAAFGNVTIAEAVPAPQKPVPHKA